MKAIFTYFEYIFVSWVKARQATSAARLGDYKLARQIMSQD